MDLAAIQKLAQDRSPARRLSAAQALASFTDLAGAAVLRKLAFHDSDHDVRREAQRHLEELRRRLPFPRLGPTTVPAGQTEARQAIAAPDLPSRLGAIEWLALAGDVDALPGLEKALAAQTDAPTRAALAVALGRLGLVRHASILARLMADSDARVRAASLEALVFLEPSSVYVQAVKGLTDPDSQVQTVSTRLLTSAGPDLVFRVLERMIDSAQPSYEEAAAHALSTLRSGPEVVRLAGRAAAARSEAARDKAARTLRRLAQAGVAGARDELTRLGAEPPPPESRLPAASFTMAGLASPDPKLRTRAVQEAGASGQADLLGVLVGLLSYETDARVLATLATSVGQLGGLQAAVPLTRLLTHKNARVVANAVEALGQSTEPAVHDALFPLRRHEHRRVRANVAVALGQVEDFNVRPTLSALAGSEDPVDRRAAAWALHKIGRPDLGDLLARLEGDADPTVSRAARELPSPEAGAAIPPAPPAQSPPPPSPPADPVLAALSSAEREWFEAAVGKMAAAAHDKTLQLSLRLEAVGVLARVASRAGIPRNEQQLHVLVAASVRQAVAASRIPPAELKRIWLEELPQPIAHRYQEYLQSWDGGPEMARKAVTQATALVETILRFAWAVLLGDRLARRTEPLEEPVRQACAGALARGLPARPTLEAIRALAESPGGRRTVPFVPELTRLPEALDWGRLPLPERGQPAPEPASGAAETAANLAELGPAVETLLERVTCLRGYVLVALPSTAKSDGPDAGDRVWQLTGAATEPSPVALTLPTPLAPGRVYLVAADRSRVLPLHPLVVFRPPESGPWRAAPLPTRLFLTSGRRSGTDALVFEDCLERCCFASGDLADELEQLAPGLLAGGPGDAGPEAAGASRYQRQRLLDLDRQFLGRAELLHAVEDWLASRPSGLMLLHGQEGRGKSTLMARLARQFGAVYHFLSARPADGSAVAVFRSLFRQLGSRFQRPVQCPSTAGAASAAFGGLLTEISEWLSPDERLVLVLDGLDEGAQASSGPALFRLLPERLPRGVHILGSCRTGSDAHFELTGADHAGLEVGPLSAEESAFVFGELARGLELPGRFVTDALAAAAGGCLYLANVLEQVRAGVLDPEKPLPDSLAGLWQGLWTASGLEGRHALRSLLALLAEAREALSSEEVALLLGRRLERLPLADLAPFVAGSGLLELRHPAFVEFVRAQQTPGERRERHAQLARHYGDWRRHGDDVALCHLPAHLTGAGSSRELAQLLADPGFLEAKAGRLGCQAILEDLGAALAADHLTGATLRGQLTCQSRALERVARAIDARPADLGPELRNQLFVDAADDPAAALLEQEVASWCSSPGRPRWLRRVSRPATGALVSGRMATSESAGELQSAAYSPDVTRVVTGGRDGAVRVWDALTGRQLHALAGHTHSVKAVAYSPDGTRLASGCHDGIVKLWATGTGREVATFASQPSQVLAIAFSPDGRLVATAGWDRLIRLWDVATGQERLALSGHAERVLAVAFSPDGSTLASGGWDHTVALWDLKGAKQLGVLEGHTHGVGAVAFSPDGGRLVSGGFDAALRVWDACTRQPVAVLAGHAESVTCLAFSAGGARLVSGGGDGTLGVWDFPRCELLCTAGLGSAAIACRWSPSGRQLCGADDGGPTGRPAVYAYEMVGG
ncbi:MAG: HEAT repeat domain-containing protein [Candidatus Riflebacteria bacterium]|nr:HEAT repeat domain-containing protein [Candidatus Riflebacteria bacterium]